VLEGVLIDTKRLSCSLARRRLLAGVQFGQEGLVVMDVDADEVLPNVKILLAKSAEQVTRSPVCDQRF
jgi:hypothetical protein